MSYVREPFVKHRENDLGKGARGYVALGYFSVGQIYLARILL